MNNKQITPKNIDALLPQTQCGLCNYSGCMPYAEAISQQNERIDLCLPGGVKTLQKLAAITGQNAEPFIEEMVKKTKLPVRAAIREDECIGCTKCIQVCPVDAIVGAAKQMHTILMNECTGCELCIAPCPVDCIELLPLNEISEEQQNQKADIARQRYNFRNYRLEKNILEKAKKFQQLKLQQRQIEILAAVTRAKSKKKITTLSSRTKARDPVNT